MEVEISELKSTIRAVDGDSLLSPQTMEKILRLVLQAVHDHEAHQQRAQAERRVTGGVSQEQRGQG